MSDDLVRFLQARYAEDAARQQNSFERWHHRDCDAIPDVLSPGVETGACTCGVPERVLAEVEAKRQLLDLHEPGEMEYVDGDVCMVCENTDVGDEGPFYPCRTLRLLAMPYADHPDYREEWKP